MLPNKGAWDVNEWKIRNKEIKKDYNFVTILLIFTKFGDIIPTVKATV